MCSLCCAMGAVGWIDGIFHTASSSFPANQQSSQLYLDTHLVLKDSNQKFCQVFFQTASPPFPRTTLLRADFNSSQRYVSCDVRNVSMATACSTQSTLALLQLFTVKSHSVKICLAKKPACHSTHLQTPFNVFCRQRSPFLIFLHLSFPL